MDIISWLKCLLYVLSLVVWKSCGAQQIHCPGDPVSISCSTATLLIWRGSALNGQCNPNNNIVLEATSLTVENISDTFVCGDFTATLTNLTSRAVEGTSTIIVTLVSSLAVTATPSLDGTTISCSDGVNDVENVPLTVPEVPTPGAMSSVMQRSLTTARVNLTVGDDRCADLYVVEVTGGSTPLITVSNTSPEFDVSGLFLCRYIYTFVAYTQAPSGAQSMRTTLRSLDTSGAELNGVSNVRTTPSTVEWDQLTSGLESRCITHYRLTWAGGMYDTPNSSTSVNAAVLSSAGFPYCQTVMVTVTPVTPIGVVTGGSGSAMAMFQHPDFVGPEISASFALQSDDMFVLTIQWQDSITIEGVPIRMYGYSTISTDCTPTSSAGSSASFSTTTVPNAQPGDSFKFCVLFQNDECMAVSSSTVSVPNRTLTDAQITPLPSGDTRFTVTLTLLPVPSPYSPNDLVIISTIDPPDAGPIVENYPTSTQQYTVTFSGLRFGTTYIYNIRVALGADNTITVGLPVTGSHIINGLFTSDKIIVSVIVTFILSLTLGVIIGVVSVLLYNKCRRGTGQSSSQPPTELKQVGPIYEEPEDFKPDPNTEGNVAYGHVQPQHRH